VLDDFTVQKVESTLSQLYPAYPDLAKGSKGVLMKDNHPSTGSG
jgi:hypothetical protein